MQWAGGGQLPKTLWCQCRAADTSFPAPPAPNSFLGTLSSLTGVAFDLPSECEWEYACRAGNYGAKWGDGSLIQLKGGADAGEDTNLTRLGAYKKNADAIQPVGSYEPNSWGLYDMHGNLWDMCLDWYGVDITALDGAVNPTPPSNNRRVDRGVFIWASLVAQMVKNLPPVQETQVRSLGREDPLETRSSGAW